jgi:N-acetyl-anhydromuramyl-L-alanine amidase AmpD
LPQPRPRGVALQIERHPTPNFAPGRDGQEPRAIVVHTNVGSYSSTVSWFARAESAVSSHYLVALDGGVGQFVDEADTARHAGRVLNPTATFLDDANPNLYTVGIEFEDGGDPLEVARPDAQYAAGSELIAAVARRWSIPLDSDHVVGHRTIYAAKECPGNLDVERLIRQARAGG